ncbi:TetR/AcrR family transcriptional regulator [Streptosporangium carneum]|uniref:TetR family transcriptional regulator n=1 Tax=Streptosporangium carneum TaxID=47481 RepID=A0A9W6MEJ5_9ACTN|nr:TetR/AcrR family transcriptional regulator [Streptosporangium carneum]GLK11202.1 TetR family transcriptional regulator [Streptosporangium carneum]
MNDGETGAARAGDADGPSTARQGRTAAGDVWFRPSRARRETPPLSRERIVREAVALLDEEGAERLTMRRLAERLGTGSTTLYWHVKTKDDVLDLALDSIFGEVGLPSGPDGGRWREDLTALVGGWRAVLLRHPWSAAVLGRPLMGPNVLDRTEFMHATLVAAGFTEPHLSAAAYGLSNYVIGSTLMQATWQARDEETARQAAEEHLRARRDRYPTLAEHGPPIGKDWDASFALGLTYLLDGLEASKL